MKINASVTKSLLQGCGPCYLHSHIFFHTLSSSTAKQNVVTITVFLSKLDHQMLFSYIYQETIVKIGFSMNNNLNTLPEVYTMLV